MTPPLLPSIPPKVEALIEATKDLDFKVFPRANVFMPWMPNIEKKNDKTFNEEYRSYLVMKASEMGYKDLKYNIQLMLGEAILRKESYIAGFKKPLMTPSTFHKMFVKVHNESCTNPINAPYVLKSKKGTNRRGYVMMLSKKFPRFLHETYRHATKTLGVSESTKRICDHMMSYAKTKYSDCPIRGNLKMNKHHFWTFFYMHGGKLQRPITKPRLTTEQIQQRLEFSKKWIEKIKTKGLYYCYLDEKWFYTTSRRKKMKILPQADFETPEDAYIPKPKLRSRRFPCKVMFMGLVCPPVKEAGTDKLLSDGKIMLKRISEQALQKRGSYNQNFVSQYEINHELKNNKWRKLYPKDSPGISARDFLCLIAEEYDLDEDVASNLVLTYNSFSQTRETKTIKKKLMKLTLEDDKPLIGNRKIRYKIAEDQLGERKVKLSDMMLRVNPKKAR